MNLLGIIILCGSVLLIAGIPILFARARKASLSFGPAFRVGGSPCAKGRLVCVSVDAPTFNKTLTFDYKMSLFTDGVNVTGECRYPADPAKKAIYAGEVMLTCRRGKVEGRSMLTQKIMSIVAGIAGPDGVDLTRGYPPEGPLKFLNGDFQFSIRDGRVYFDNTVGAQANTSTESRLQIKGSRLTGRLLHAPQRSWAVDVDVAYRGIRDELAALAVILMCDDILSFHHD